MLKNNKVLMLLSLAISVALWFYVMGTVNPNMEAHITNIPVTMVGEESLDKVGVSATLDSPKEVSIVISGKRSAVNKAKKKTFQAVIDVSTCDMGKNTATIIIKKPEGVSGITIESKSQETATFTVK